MIAPGRLLLDHAGRDVLDRVQAIVRVWTPAAGVLYVNRAWRDLTGTTLEQNVGDGWIDVVHDEDRARLLDAVRQHPGGTPTQYRLRTRDGRHVPVRDDPTALIDEATGLVLGLVHTIVRAEPAPVDDRSLSLSKWAHELRGPLNAILGWSDLLAAGESDPAVLQRGLQAIATNARLQARIIKQMAE